MGARGIDVVCFLLFFASCISRWCVLYYMDFCIRLHVYVRVNSDLSRRHLDRPTPSTGTSSLSAAHSPRRPSSK